MATSDNSNLVLYRPVGSRELALIEAAGWRAFPPRLPEQPIFYPVTNARYAEKIAQEWNARLNEDRVGFVTRFSVGSDYIARYETHIVGASWHEEYWIPAEELDEFNRNIIGTIEVTARYDDAEPAIEQDER
ncbi:ADP-ribosylation/crystallin J1 [Acuticoccus sediminis]|uniref:ADP-ribosylation/crystallin J1 n=1 Tax=Acuticoccus sediminis TaxID=2184697 RepID=UPI001CFD8666|nr:ADP-ribosylation/crystallin J1 [Acuticoccus sediminis]